MESKKEIPLLRGGSVADGVFKKLFTYATPKSDPELQLVSNINPYLVEGDNIVIRSRSKPISNVPEMSFGNMPNDDGNLLFTEGQKNEFIQLEPNSEKYFREIISAREFLNNEKKYCLWLVDINPSELKNLPKVLGKVQNIKEYRAKSTRQATQKLALYPTLFGEIRQPKTNYILIPRVSSETREYIPMGFFDGNYIANNTCYTIPNATLFHFAILTSKMHMAWVKVVCGRLKSDFRYSKDIVYNNFPFPAIDSDTKIEQLAQNILEIRLKYVESSLADLYNPLTMPPDLAKAHSDLDRAVDRLYSKSGFQNDSQRVSHLFGLYTEIEVKGKK